jgi:WD40 repeat protein
LLFECFILIDAIGSAYGVRKDLKYSFGRSIIIWKIEYRPETTTLGFSFLAKFYGHDARVWKCEWLRFDNCLYLCSIGEDLKCCVWSVDDKRLKYQFNAIRKGSKNIWSLFANDNDTSLITGWADGGIRRYELRNYLMATTDDPESCLEWCMDYETNDFPKTMQLINSCVIVCTNNGHVYMSKFDDNQQRLLFSNSNLKTHNCMAKLTISTTESYLAIGSLHGQIYLFSDFQDDLKTPKTTIVDCSAAIPDHQRICGGNYKVSSLLWHTTPQGRNHLLVSLAFHDGLMQLYELQCHELQLTACMYLPICKHRWSTSFTLFTPSHQSTIAYYLICGDKCGNLNLYELDNEYLRCLKPKQTLETMTNHGSAITAIYSKGDQVICCSRDGVYRLIRFNAHNEQQQPLSVVNKFEINSSIDIIESFVFNPIENGPKRNIDEDILLGLCFYGDKFLLWSFVLNRSIVEIKCGGLKRSWDHEFNVNDFKRTSDNCSVDFKFAYIRNKSIVKINKRLHMNDLVLRTNLRVRHLMQTFHGNNIACCKYVGSYLITGSEDTHAIITQINENGQQYAHEYYLQGHESVVKCLCKVYETEMFALVLTAGGKATIKLWKLFFDKNKQIVNAEQTCEFAKFTPGKPSDLISDIRLMDVDVASVDKDTFFLYFACSDGSLR